MGDIISRKIGTNEKSEEGGGGEETGEKRHYSCPKGGFGVLNSMLNLNARGLVLMKDRTKVKQLGLLAREYNCNIMMITETWLNDSVESGEVYIDGYSMYRTDRVGRQRGGVCIYIKSNIPVSPILQFSNGAVEIMILKIPLWDMVLGAIYRPPDTSINEWNQASEMIKNAINGIQSNGRFQNVVLTGDMNFPNINWDDINGGNMSENSQIKTLQSIMNEFFLHQIIDQPTRKDKILDLILTNNRSLFSHHETIVNSIYSDHNTIISYLNTKYENEKCEYDITALYDTKIPRLKLSDSDNDWENYEEYMNTQSWSELSNDNDSIQEKVRILFEMIETSMEKVFPLKS